MSFWTHCAGIIRHDWLSEAIVFDRELSEPEILAEELKEKIRILEILYENIPKGSESHIDCNVISPYLITIEGDLRDVGENKEVEWKEIEDWFRNACEKIGDIRQGIMEINNLNGESKVIQIKSYIEDAN